MYLHLKQSGELLTSLPAEPWTRDAVYGAADHIKDLHDHAQELDLEGIMVVSGAGNILRGEKMRQLFEGSNMSDVSDVVGRIATVQNTIMLSAALRDLGVPFQIFIAPSMNLQDNSFSEVPTYDVQAVHEAYKQGKIVLMAGGSGKDNQTTDAAVTELMIDHAKHFAGTENVAYKATRFNGVYDQDPRTNPGAPRYKIISANTMLADYDRFSAVDKRCLELLSEAPDDVMLRVYSTKDYTPLTAVQAVRRKDSPGTLIVSQDMASIMAE